MDEGKEDSCYFREKVNKTERCYKVKCNVMKVALGNLPGCCITPGREAALRKARPSFSPASQN